MRKVKTAGLHDTLQIPGIGDMGKTINTNDAQYKFRDVQMVYTPEGVEITVKGQQVLVPVTNFRYLLFAETPKPVAVA